MSGTRTHQNFTTKRMFKHVLLLILAFTFWSSHFASSPSQPLKITLVDCISIDPSVLEENNDHAVFNHGRVLKVVKKIVFQDNLWVKIFSLIEQYPKIFFENFSLKISTGVISLLYLFHLF
jgi:hypothetical protein